MNKHQNLVVICAFRFLQLDFSPPDFSHTGKFLHGHAAREGAKEDMDRDTGNSRTFTETKVSTHVTPTSSQL